MGWVAIVPAAGSGSRLRGSGPKALVRLGGRPMLAHTLEALREVPFERIVVAAPDGLESEVRSLLGPAEDVVAGGATRAESVRLAFAALGARAGDIVCIHDAARPFVTASEMAEVLRAAERGGAAIAAAPVVDTLKRVEGGRIMATVDRDGLWSAGTPQAFREDLLRRALAAGDEATDEAALCERLGVEVLVTPVSRLGFKITTPEDLVLAEAVLARRA